MPLRASRLRLCFGLSMHAGALIAAWFLPVEVIWRAALCGLVLASMLWALRPLSASAGQSMPIGIRLSPQGDIGLRFATAPGATSNTTRDLEFELGSGSVVLPWLVRLGLSEPVTGQGACSWVIWPDQLAPNDFRRLRLELGRLMQRRGNLASQTGSHAA